MKVVRTVVPENFLTDIETRFKLPFEQKVAYENTNRIQLLFFFAAFFLPLFFLLDYIRYKKGLLNFDIIGIAQHTMAEWGNLSIQTKKFWLYFLLHLSHMMFIPLLWVSSTAILKRKQIKRHEFDEVIPYVRNYLKVLSIALIPAAILAMYERESLALTMIYSVLINIILVLDHRKSIFWNILGFLLVGTSFMFLYKDPTDKLVEMMELFAIFGIPFIISRTQYGLRIREFEYQNKLNEQNHIIQLEKEKSDELLLNILPLEIARELKDKGYSDAQQFDQVSVLFCDFVNFTGVTEKLSPKQLIGEIHYCFKNFDQIMGRYGLEKIKTIGDAYLAVSGLPKAGSHNVDDVISASKEIVEFISTYKTERDFLNGTGWGVRIGISSGPVIAGIVGVKKFAYDIWGDTVNTAARMQQYSEPGRINISKSTYELVKDRYNCEYRGKLQAKNKGLIDMYFLNP